MNKLKIIAASVIICGAIAAWFYFKPSKAELEQKRVTEIIAKGDSTIVEALASGDTSSVLQGYRSNSIRECIRTYFFKRFTLEKDLVPISNIEKVFLKKCFDLCDWTPHILWYENDPYEEMYKFKGHVQIYTLGKRWYKRMELLEEIISPRLKMELEKYKNPDSLSSWVDDPIMAAKGMSWDSIKPLFLKGVERYPEITSRPTSFLYTRDSLEINDFVQSAPDEVIVAMQLSNLVPLSRVLRISKKLDLRNGFKFLTHSHVSKDDICQFVLSKIGQANIPMLLNLYRSGRYISKNTLYQQLSTKSTDELVSSGYNSFIDIDYSLIGDDYYEIRDYYCNSIITSVKSSSDYRMAAEFFMDNEKYFGKGWLELLRKKSKI